MPVTNAPNTLAIGLGIVTYLAALTNPDTTPLYTLVQLEAIKDITDFVANGGACCEVYGNSDDSDRRGFGGRIWDTQSWFILSMCELTSPASAQKIYTVRDTLVVPFQTHAVLGGSIYNLFHAQFKPNSGKFWRVLRNGEFYRAHLIELITKQEWQVLSPPGVIA